MKTDVIMPQMGESIAEGTLTKWIKKVGEPVQRDEPLFEISTDKVDAEIPSPAAGVLAEILVPEGETVAINTVVARIEAAAAVAAQAAPAGRAAAPAPAAGAADAPVPRAPGAPGAAGPPGARAASTPAAPPAPARPAGAPATREELRRTRSSPLVRRIAAEQGVDIAGVRGTGISGRVTKEDLLALLRDRGASSGAAPPAAGAERAAGPAWPTPPAPPPWSGDDRVRVEPMSVMRRKIAEHMILSRRTAAHVSTVFEVEMTRVAALRQAHKNRWVERHGVKLTYMPFLVKACVEALKAFPVVNASVDGESIVYHRDINVGVAVALDWGLIVPVVKNAEEKSLLGLARAMADLADRARSKKLLPDEVHGGTFSITNPGVFGSLFGTPIINQPQVAILGVGTIEKRVVVREDAIAIRPMVFLALTFDHRLVDGATADQFMAHVKRTLEEGRFDRLE